MFVRKAISYMAPAFAVAAALSASPAQADPQQEWQEKHRDPAFLAGRWLDTNRGDEFTWQGNQLVLSRKRSNHYQETPVGFAVVTNIRFSKVARSNPTSVQYEFTATCNQYRPNGNHFSYPANQFLVIVTTATKEQMIEGFSRIGSQCVSADRPPVLMAPGAASSHPAVPVAGDDPAVDQQFLALVQGEWESRHQSDDSAVRIAGREVRLVRTKNLRTDLRNTPRLGDVVGIIDSIKPWGQVKSPVTGAIEQNYLYTLRGMEHDGQTWSISATARIGRLLTYTFTQEPKTGFRRIPVFDYRMLTSANSFLGEYWRPDDKARIFGKAPLPTPATARPGGAQPNRPVIVRPQAAATPPADPPLSIPVTSEQEQRELAERERLNREQAEFGTRQLAENEANRQAYEKALREREATIARQKAEHEAALAAVEAERLRREREHEAAMARWRADVEACKKGDKSRCAQ